MFGWINRNANEAEQNVDPGFRYKGKKGLASPLSININNTKHQSSKTRPPDTISYLSPTSAEGDDTNAFKNRTDSRQVEASTTRYTSMNNERDQAPTRYKDISTSSLVRLEKLDPAHPMIASRSCATSRSQALDLKHNDNSFHIIAKLLVDRFEEHLSNENVKTIRLSAGDLYHLNRVVPGRQSFIEAVRYRLKECPDDSSKPIHLVTRQCHALGLDRDGEANLLYAPIGTNFPISRMRESKSASRRTFKVNNVAIQNAQPNTPDELARQQLTTELQEASNLMSESVTAEASQFWRNQVAELQGKLRALHGKGIKPTNVTNLDTTNVITESLKANETVLSGLWQNIGYVPPTQDKQLEVISSFDTDVENNNGKDTLPPGHSSSENELPIVDVVAPSDLPGGYQFEAEINDKRFLATVPNGGIRKGQTFYCYMKVTNDEGIPVGRWRDRPFDCFKYGFRHPMLLLSFLCPLLALAQVMERVGLDITGRKPIENTPQDGLWSPRGMAISILCFWAGLNLTIVSGLEFKLHSYVTVSAADFLSIILVNASMIAFTIKATINTRDSLMERYQIPIGRLGSRNETIKSIILFPLTIAQMGRHTTSYEHYEGVWCNATGFVEHQGP